MCRGFQRSIFTNEQTQLYEAQLIYSLPGGAPQDAPETAVLASFINKLAASAQKLKLFIDYHSYSQLFMTRMSFPHLRIAIEISH